MATSKIEFDTTKKSAQKVDVFVDSLRSFFKEIPYGTDWIKHLDSKEVAGIFLEKMRSVISDYCFILNGQLDAELMQSNLIGRVSESDHNKALQRIRNNKEEINQYSLIYGNTPILLAISKGWNHVNTDSTYAYGNTLSQQLIIEVLLKEDTLEINSPHLLNGMTPLHIACLRGDDPTLIEKLIQKGADIHAVDYAGKKPLGYLSARYTEVKETVRFLSSGNIGISSFGGLFGLNFNNTNYNYNQSNVATIPTTEDRENNSEAIRKLFIQAEEKLSLTKVEANSAKFEFLNAMKKEINEKTGPGVGFFKLYDKDPDGVTRLRKAFEELPTFSSQEDEEKVDNLYQEVKTILIEKHIEDPETKKFYDKYLDRMQQIESNSEEEQYEQKHTL